MESFICLYILLLPGNVYPLCLVVLGPKPRALHMQAKGRTIDNISNTPRAITLQLICIHIHIQEHTPTRKTYKEDHCGLEPYKRVSLYGVLAGLEELRRPNCFSTSLSAG